MRLPLAILLFLPLATFAEQPPGPAPLWPAQRKYDTTDNKEITTLILQLGDPTFRTREAATNRLLSLGNAARLALETAATGPDAEIATRARALIPQLQHYPPPPGIPARLAKAFITYYQSDFSDSDTSLQQRPSFPNDWNFYDTEQAYALIEILSRIFPNEYERERLRRYVVAESEIPARQAILDGDFPRAKALLAASLVQQDIPQKSRIPSDVQTPAANLASLLYLENPNDKEPADVVVERLRKEHQFRDASAQHVIVSLMRARGNFSGAAAYADAHFDQLAGLAPIFHWEASEWELALKAFQRLPWETHEVHSLSAPPEALCYKFMGEPIKAAAFVDTVAQNFAGNAPHDVNRHTFLLANGRMDETINILKKRNNVDALRALLMLWNFRAADEIAKTSINHHDSITATVALMHAESLDRLGAPEKVREVLLSISNLDRNYNGLNDPYNRLALKISLINENPTPSLQDIPRIDYQEASAWNLYLDYSRNRTPEKFRRIRSILEKSLPPDQMTQALVEAGQQIYDKSVSMTFVRKYFLDSLRRLGRLDVAKEIFTAAAQRNEDPAVYAFAGDAELELGHFADALAYFQRAATVQRTDASLVWRAGFAALKLGKPEGRQLMAAAELLPLSDYFARRDLADAMRSCGEIEAAEKQEALMCRFAPFSGNSVYLIAGYYEKLCERSLKKGDVAAALSFHKIAMMYPGGLESATTLHRLSALVALQKSDLQTAYAETDQFLTISIPDADLIAKVIPALRAAKQSDLANALLTRALARVQPVVDDYPNFKPAADLLTALKNLQ